MSAAPLDAAGADGGHARGGDIRGVGAAARKGLAKGGEAVCLGHLIHSVKQRQIGVVPLEHRHRVQKLHGGAGPVHMGHGADLRDLLFQHRQVGGAAEAGVHIDLAAVWDGVGHGAAGDHIHADHDPLFIAGESLQGQDFVGHLLDGVPAG